MTFSFGSSSTTANKSPTTSGFSFGNTNNSTKPATTTSSFSFGNNNSKPASGGFSFGGSSTSKSTTGFSFGNTASGQNNQNDAALNFSFNNLPDKPATPDQKKSVTFNPTLESSSQKGDLGGQNKPENSDPISILKKNEDEKNTDPTNKGDASTTDSGQNKNDPNNKDGSSGSNNAQKESILEQQIPKEIFEDISKFEAHINDSLNVKSKNIANTTSRSIFDKVQKRIEKCNYSVQKLTSSMKSVENEVGTLVKNLRLVRDDSLIAQRTDSISPAMQFENLAPISYLYQQVERFHACSLEYDRQIMELESAMRAKAASNGQPNGKTEQKTTTTVDLSNLSGEDLIKFLDKFQNSFLKIACQYFSIHNTLQMIKTEYVSYRNRTYGASKKPLNFSDQSNTASKEAELIASLEDIRVNKSMRADNGGSQANNSPFSGYNTHILANIVKSNITKQLTDPNSVQKSQPQQNNNNSFGGGGFSFGGGSNNNDNKPSTGFSFGGFGSGGTTNNNNTTSTTGGFSFGGNKTTSTTSGFTFGGSSTQNKLNTSGSSGGGFSFGNTASKPASSGFSFGNTAGSGGGFSFGKK